MAYNKVNWSANTPISVSNLEHMDEGIKNANDKNIMTIGLTSNTNVSISTIDTFFKMPLNNQIGSLGDKLTFDTTNNGIVIGEGVSYVKVSCFTLVRGITSSLRIAIQKNEQQLASGYSNSTTTTNWDTVTISPIIIPVNSGDIFTLNVAASATGSITAGGSVFTGLTVEVIE